MKHLTLVGLCVVVVVVVVVVILHGRYILAQYLLTKDVDVLHSCALKGWIPRDNIPLLQHVTTH